MTDITEQQLRNSLESADKALTGWMKRATAAEAALAEAVKERDAAWNKAIEAAARKLGCRNKFTETEAIQIVRALKDTTC